MEGLRTIPDQDRRKSIPFRSGASPAYHHKSWWSCRCSRANHSGRPYEAIWNGRDGRPNDPRLVAEFRDRRGDVSDESVKTVDQCC